MTGTGDNTPPFAGSFLAFLPHAFAGIYGDGMITLPLLVWLQRDAGRRLVAALARLAEAPGAIFLFALPLAPTEALIRLGFGPDNEEGGWHLVTYVVLLVIGFLIVEEIETGPSAHSEET